MFAARMKAEVNRRAFWSYELIKGYVLLQKDLGLMSRISDLNIEVNVLKDVSATTGFCAGCQEAFDRDYDSRCQLLGKLERELESDKSLARELVQALKLPGVGNNEV